MRLTSFFLASTARLARQRGRTLLSIAGIALGVALGFAVNLINRAAVEEMAAGTRVLAGEADLEVQGGRSGFPEQLYPALARLEGVAVASPVLDLQAGIADRDTTIRLIGVDSLRAALIQPALFADDPARRFELLKPDAVFLSAAAAQLLALDKGDTLRIVSGLSTVQMTVAGVLPASSLRGIAALTDVATAQWRLERLGELNRIDLRLSPGVDREQMGSRIAAMLPAGVHVVTADALQESGANLSRAYRVNLNVLALVALFTGGFLVFSAQSLEVVRRRGEHALLRVLGLRRRGILALVLTEAAAIGAIASVLGLALGYALARVALAFGGADLGAGMFRGVTPALAVSPGVMALYFASGVAISVAGATLPALEASRIAPAQALKAGDEQRMFERLATVAPGIAFLLAALALSFAPPVAGIPLGGYVSIACLLVGGILLMPWLAQTTFARFPEGALRRTPVALALAQLRGAPGQAMVSLAAIVASFSLMVAMAIMVASFRESVDRWLHAVLPADLYFRTTNAGETGWIDPPFEESVRRLPQVKRAEFVRSARIILDPRRPGVSLLARDSTAEGESLRFPLVGRSYARAAGDPPPAWISEGVADVYGYRPGDRLELPLGGARHAFVVAGIWRDYARQHGAIVVPRASYIEATGDQRANDAALWLAPDATAAQAIEALRRLPGGAQLEISGPGEIRTASLRIFDRTFAVTYALEAVAVLVGLFGLSASVGAIVLARRREFGMLRHVGVTRRQIGEMLAAEGGLLALLGVGAGLLLGALISLVLIFVVNRQSFSWSMDVHLPYGLLAALSLLLIFLAALTGYFSGREATGMDPVRSVKEDW
ncbi:MAG TPA: FtsX-like permease family protein [Burkholderiales bacterium]|nr:FtsX-like permease family protein [Burkholderiales bacterium]